MDVFPPIESTNNEMLVSRLVAIFNKVEDSINQSGFDVANQIRRLPVSESWNDRNADKMLEPDDPSWVIITVLTVAFVMALLLLSYWLLWKTIQEILKKCDDHTKVTEEVDLEKDASERKKPRMSANRARKLTLFLSLDLWMVFLVVLLFNIHVNTYLKIGANLNSVQFLVGDGTMTTMDIEDFMITRLVELNKEMQEGTEILEETLKYHIKVQDDILKKIHGIVDKVGWMNESTDNLQDFMKEATAKTMCLILSSSFFFTYIIVTWFGLTQISKMFTNQLVLFFVTMLGHILMFFFIMALYIQVFTDALGRIHPDSRSIIP